MPQKVAKNPLILLVEDEPFLLGMYQTKLKLEGYEVITAVDGEDALEKIKQKPDLILLDIMMPKLNGFQVLSTIRKEQKLKTPVIMLTNLGQKSDVEQAMQLGANDYIIKAHFTPAEVITKIKTQLGENK